MQPCKGARLLVGLLVGRDDSVRLAGLGRARERVAEGAVEGARVLGRVCHYADVAVALAIQCAPEVGTTVRLSDFVGSPLLPITQGRGGASKQAQTLRHNLAWCVCKVITHAKELTQAYACHA